MRPCHVRIDHQDYRAWFHRWGTRQCRDGTSATIAIVELDDGRVKGIWPDLIRFDLPGPRGREAQVIMGALQAEEMRKREAEEATAEPEIRY
jgi:hypothetical protein